MKEFIEVEITFLPYVKDNVACLVASSVDGFDGEWDMWNEQSGN